MTKDNHTTQGNISTVKHNLAASNTNFSYYEDCEVPFFWLDLTRERI